MATPSPVSNAPVVTAKRLRIVVRGAVQGVGFRPFVYRQASAHGLSGWVGNSSEGVFIEAEGRADDLEALIRKLHAAPPPGATVTDMEVHEIRRRGDLGFAIRASEAAGPLTAQVPPDLATCEACMAELFDPADRRYRYPFINCTRCGPRYTIVESMPYDRARTSMRRFTMCDACREEYLDPRDRRFHAEPNACPECGPRLALCNTAGSLLARDDAALLRAAQALRAGQILAVKGIGGFHLFVDARDESAVRRLREGKRRDAKPFAVMFPTLAEVRASCRPGPVAEALLGGPARPIVLLRRSGGPVASVVAPGSPRLGALLPYSPLHHLLMAELGFPLVATSGNVSDEPIVTDEGRALERLAGCADAFLIHDRPIVRPVDDSVAQVVCGAPQLLRRARGYAPGRVAAGAFPEGIVACGGHLKATVALSVGGGVMASQHLGDLETPMARDAYQQALADILRLHAARARVVVRDAHPDYASRAAAESFGRPVLDVQHHLAHVAACMAEHAIPPPALGVAWDGTGYGPDGSVWGGEFLRVTETGWRRVAHLRPFPLPGGAAAVREPRRAALGLLFAIYGDDVFAMTDLAPIADFAPAERNVLHAMLKRGVNAPLTTSAGRLFDAFASLCGLQQRAGYEGQAAAALEWAADGCTTGRSYAMPLMEMGEQPLIVDWGPALGSALPELRDGMPAGAISAALHNGLAAAIAAVASHVGEQRIVLTGGCFQNTRLTEASVATLAGAGFSPFWHRRVPPNDGGIAVGQAVWAAWHEMRERRSCA